jgi:hypothetical protein
MTLPDVRVITAIRITDLSADELSQVLAWRRPTDFSHPFRGQAEVWGHNGNPDLLEIIPEDWLGTEERRRRGFLAAPPLNQTLNEKATA